MICDQCGADNVGDGSFCFRCGSSLGWVCSCAYSNRADAFYCGGCGNPATNKKQAGDSSSNKFHPQGSNEAYMDGQQSKTKHDSQQFPSKQQSLGLIPREKQGFLEPNQTIGSTKYQAVPQKRNIVESPEDPRPPHSLNNEMAREFPQFEEDHFNRTRKIHDVALPQEGLVHKFKQEGISPTTQLIRQVLEASEDEHINAPSEEIFGASQYLIEQLSDSQIKRLLEESLTLRFVETDVITQNDINRYFEE